MPWKVPPMSDVRMAFVLQVRSTSTSVAEACRRFGISRKTGYKWLARHAADPQATLQDRSRRPKTCAGATPPEVEQRVLEVRDTYHWGPRKIHAFLKGQVPQLPSICTLANILQRNGRILPRVPQTPLQAFERSQPHELWQCDFKGPLEVARQRTFPFTVLDDHSRYLLCLRPCLNVSMVGAFEHLWNAFGEFGMPERILCDNAFGTTYSHPKTLSWFESRLVRLGIHTSHGRPYHPQTQGKVERLHGTLERELWPHIPKHDLTAFTDALERWRCEVYNTQRPHEALGDRPPVTRFQPSPRKRPERLPDLEYPAEAILRKVDHAGKITYRGYTILAGRGLLGERVRLVEAEHELQLFYAWKLVRCIAQTELARDKVL